MFYKIFFYPFLKVASYLFKKKDNVWVFGAWFGNKFADNPKAFYEYVQNSSEVIKCIWICADKELAQKINNDGNSAYLYYSFKGLYFQLVASKAFVSHSLSADLMPGCFNRYCCVFNLWHGMPLKKIMYDVHKGKPLIQSIKNSIKKIIDWQSYLVATSETTRVLMSNAFEHPLDKVIITGLPRNDILLKPLRAIDDLFNVYYMPTMREQSHIFDFFENYGFMFEKIDLLLLQNKIRLNIRLHPMNEIAQCTYTKIKQCKAIKIDTTDDVYDSLRNCHCLITDYSSILFDYLILDRPILFFCFDLGNYLKNEREMYFHYENIMCGQSSICWNDLIQKVIEIKNKGLDNDSLQQLSCLKEKFHNKKSKLACEEIFYFINKS